MAASQVARLVGDNADDLVRRLRLQQRAGVDEDAPPRDEGVEARVIDQDDFNAGFGQTGGLEDGPGVVAYQRLDLSVANDCDVLRMGRQTGRKRHQGADHADRDLAGKDDEGVELEYLHVGISRIRAPHWWKGG